MGTLGSQTWENETQGLKTTARHLHRVVWKKFYKKDWVRKEGLIKKEYGKGLVWKVGRKKKKKDQSM